MINLKKKDCLNYIYIYNCNPRQDDDSTVQTEYQWINNLDLL